MAEIESAKLISYIKVVFVNEAEMELYVSMFEKEGEAFWKQIKEVGVLRWRLNRVWNKEGGFELSQIFEYRDEDAYTKGQKLLGEVIAKNKVFFDKITIKRLPSRAINLLDYYE